MMYNPYSLEGKRILVTGASSGIGRATAIECSRLGAHVIITARNEEHLSETFSMLEGSGHEIRTCDLSNAEAIIEMVQSLSEVQGLVNNAGTNHQAPIPFIKEKVLHEILQVNTIAPVLLTSLMARRKKLTKGASIVFTNSISGMGKISTGNTMYATSKGAITAFVMGAAKELADKGIRVNAVCPGMVETNFIAHHVVASEELLDADRKSYPLKRYGRPEEIAWAITYLLSDATAWMTGTNIIIDGGRNLK